METTAAVHALGALAQDTRLRVFRLLVRETPGGLPAGAIARRLGVPANTLSSHLKVLSDGGLVAGARAGRQVIYAVRWEGVRELLGFLTEECCGGRPDGCATLIREALPGASP